MRKGTCFYFNGLVNSICEAGVNYRELVSGDQSGWARRLPCTDTKWPSDDSIVKVPCQLYREPTRKELDDFKEKLHESKIRFNLVIPLIIQMKKDFKHKNGIRAVICPACGGKLHMSIAGYNGHVMGRCETTDCLEWME